MIGVWEAVGLPQAFRVFRLELASTGLSTLTQGMPPQVAIPAFGDVVTKLNVNDGSVLITLKTTHASLIGVQTSEEGRLYVSTGISALKGFARVCGEGNGVMHATLTLEPESRAPRIWTLTFYKNGRGTLGDSIKAMEQNAEDLANKIRLEKCGVGEHWRQAVSQVLRAAQRWVGADEAGASDGVSQLNPVFGRHIGL